MSTDLQGRVLHTGSAAETEAVGARLAADLGPGELILIEGDVGAGKTTLVRGVCRALGIAGRVTSPTFTIGQTYEGEGVRISHLDLYRIADTAAEDPGLLDDYLTPESIGLVEWPAAGGDELRSRAKLIVEIRHAGENRRELLIHDPPQGPRDGARSW